MQKDNKTGIIIAAVVVVVVLIGGVVFAMNSSKDSDNKDNSSQSQNESMQDSGGQMEAGQQDIVALASGNQDLSTLVTAVKAAELVETLQGTGPFTVFAPANSAFDSLPAGTVEDLLKTENKEQLAGILTYHVVAGEAMSSSLTDGQKIKTVQGGELTVKIADGKVQIIDGKGNAANVVTADVKASNGVVHVIDAVLMQ